MASNINPVDDPGMVRILQPLVKAETYGMKYREFNGTGLAANTKTDSREHNNVTNKIDLSDIQTNIKAELGVTKDPDQKINIHPIFAAEAPISGIYEERIEEEALDIKNEDSSLYEHSTLSQSILGHKNFITCEERFEGNEYAEKSSSETQTLTKAKSNKQNASTSQTNVTLIHSGEKPFKCHLCGYMCTKKSMIKKHVIAHSRKMFECDLCDYKCLLKKQLKIHVMGIHDPEKPFHCSCCGFQTAYRSSMVKHTRRHRSGKPFDSFECKSCNSKFCQRKQLNVHMKVHAVHASRKKLRLRKNLRFRKNLQCKLCNRKFLKKSRFKFHMTTHANQKPFECKICKQEFWEKRQLDLHTLTHTVTKPFECYICNHKFYQKGRFKSHMLTHKIQKAFECNLCKRKFSQISNFNLHMKKHSIVTKIVTNLLKNKNKNTISPQAKVNFQ